MVYTSINIVLILKVAVDICWILISQLKILFLQNGQLGFEIQNISLEGEKY